MKSTVLLIVTLIAVMVVACAQNSPAPATIAAATAPVGTVKLPDDRSADLKKIQDKQDQLARDFQSLEQQKIIIAQGAALDLIKNGKMTAGQLDTMELGLDQGAYIFKPKSPETLAAEAKAKQTASATPAAPIPNPVPKAP